MSAEERYRNEAHYLTKERDEAVAKVYDLTTTVNNLQFRLSAAEEENKRLNQAKAAWEHRASDLQSRLSELQDFHAKKMDEMHARLSALQEDYEELWTEARERKNRLEQSEEARNVLRSRLSAAGGEDNNE